MQKKKKLFDFTITNTFKYQCRFESKYHSLNWEYCLCGDWVVGYVSYSQKNFLFSATTSWKWTATDIPQSPRNFKVLTEIIFRNAIIKTQIQISQMANQALKIHLIGIVFGAKVFDVYMTFDFRYSCNQISYTPGTCTVCKRLCVNSYQYWNGKPIQKYYNLFMQVIYFRLFFSCPSLLIRFSLNQLISAAGWQNPNHQHFISYNVNRVERKNKKKIMNWIISVNSLKVRY